MTRSLHMHLSLVIGKRIRLIRVAFELLEITLSGLSDEVKVGPLQYCKDRVLGK